MSALEDLKPQEEEQLYFFPKGLPGFEETRYFRLFEEDTALAQLVAANDEKIGFILVRPEVMDVDYEWELDPETERELRSGRESDSHLNFDVWLVLTLNRQDVHSSTVNLKAPLMLNREDKVGVQIILDDERYASRQPLVKRQAQKGAED